MSNELHTLPLSLSQLISSDLTYSTLARLGRGKHRGPRSVDGGGTVVLWDVATGQPVGDPLTGHTDSVESVAFSPDGTILASAGSDDGTVLLSDVATGRIRGDPLSGHTREVVSVAFSPDGTTLASASDDGTVWLWDVATGQPLGDPLTGHTNGAESVAFSPDGATLASVSNDGAVLLWDAATGQLLDMLGERFDRLSDVAFSPDGATLASTSWDGTVRLWGLPTFAAACSLANSGPLPAIPSFLEKRVDHWACEELVTAGD